MHLESDEQAAVKCQTLRLLRIRLYDQNIWQERFADMRNIFGNSRLNLIQLEQFNSGGNKFYKLKYNLIEAQRQACSSILSFGGAWSNHILALAGAGREKGFDTIGVIRGERPTRLSPTLSEALKLGMQLEFVSRQQYRNKNDADFLAGLRRKFGAFYLLSEGGTNALAVQGWAEIVTEIERFTTEYNLVCLPVGTGGTLAGVAVGLPPGKRVLGFANTPTDAAIRPEHRPITSFLLNSRRHCVAS